MQLLETQFHELDEGTVFSFDAGEDVTGAQSVQLLFRKPDGTEFAKNGTANGNLIQYIVLESDTEFDQHGLWKWQGWARFGPGQEWSTSEDQFWAGERLATPN